MVLYMSLNVLANFCGNDFNGSKWKARVLFRLKDSKGIPQWICAHRSCINEGKRMQSWYTVPNYLQCCGILIDAGQPTTSINSIIPEELVKDDFYVFKWDTPNEGDASLQESVRWFRAARRDFDIELTELQLTELNWVEDDMAELARRGYSPLASTLWIELPLQLEQNVELTQEMLGVKRLEGLPEPLHLVVAEFLNDRLGTCLTSENEALEIDIADTIHLKTDNKLIDTGYSNLSFGEKNGYSKHALICLLKTDEGTENESNVVIKLVWQTTCIVPTELFDYGDTGKLAGIAIEAFRHLAKMAYGPRNDWDVRLFITPQERTPPKVKEAVFVSTKNLKVKRGSKGGKAKGLGDHNKKPQTPQSTTVDILKCNVPLTIAIGQSQRDTYLTITLDKATGNMMIRANNTGAALTQEKLERIKMCSILKTFVPRNGEHDSVLSFGGVTLSIPNMVGHGDGILDECITQPHPGNHIKMLINSKDISDSNILIMVT